MKLEQKNTESAKVSKSFESALGALTVYCGGENFL